MSPNETRFITIYEDEDVDVSPEVEWNRPNEDETLVDHQGQEMCAAECDYGEQDDQDECDDGHECHSSGFYLPEDM